MKVSDAAVLSELTTFLNQIETHTGKAAILKLSSKFEARYHVAAAIDRNLWLVRTRFQPDYAGRPWMLWTANPALANPAGEAPLRWVVVQR
jgi:lysozyme